MKPILLRMFALGTVIAFGLIAIAQAQRSAAPSGLSGSTPLRSDSASAGSQLAASGNPLRADSTRATTNRNVSPQATGSAGSPTLAPASPGFSLTAATDAGMVAPLSAPEVSGAAPVAPNFESVASQMQAGPTPDGFSPTLAAPAGLPMMPAGETQQLNVPAVPSMPAMPSFESPSLAGQPMSVGRGSAEPGPIDIPNAQPTAQERASATFAQSPIQPALTGPQSMAGTGRPGFKNLEGAQSPQLLIEKIAPAEIQVGRPAVFEIHVRNVGAVAATNVEIRDEIPEGTRLESTTPRASQSATGGLLWKVGTLKPDQDVSVEMELMPTDEGDIGSVATVHFTTEASVRTRATRPLLAIETEASDKVLKGEELSLKITVSNPGTGIAENVVLEEHVPPGFRHTAGAELEYEVGDLAPNESRELTLVLEAVHPGALVNVISARGEPNLEAKNERPVQVIAPELEVVVDGPSKRFLECEAVYNFSVRNPGTAPAKQVELAVEVPAGMKFVSGTNQAYYEEATRTVHWMVEEIPVQDGPPPVQLTLMPIEAGDHKIRLVSADDSGAKAEVEQAVHVEGIAAMYFEVADLQDPIEVGSQTLYEIRVVNQGSKEATNVQVAAGLPPGLRAVAAEGPTPQVQTGQSNVVAFKALPRLAPKADVTYRVRVEGVQTGDFRMKVQLTTDDLNTPITKEESTRVYSSQ